MADGNRQPAARQYEIHVGSAATNSEWRVAQLLQQTKYSHETKADADATKTLQTLVYVVVGIVSITSLVANCPKR